ncbi:hypothetical protein ACH4TC_18605 [Streptomyces spororaveus]|uniref:hypothetical protein n=1 Tax=Streptomyces spororaveus TaxID=284039 RepID=UPI003796EFAC
MPGVHLAHKNGILAAVRRQQAPGRLQLQRVLVERDLALLVDQAQWTTDMLGDYYSPT